MDATAEVRKIRLICPICVKEGRTEPVEVSPDFVRIPALLERWVPKWGREKGFVSLQQAVAKDARFAVLIVKINGRDEALGLCVQHGFALREAKIWTEKLSTVEERRAAAAERKATEAFDSIGAMLGGKQALAAGQSKGAEPEGEDAGDQARAEQEAIQRKLAASAKARKTDKPKGKESSKGRKPLASKGRAKGKLAAEIDEALEGDAS